MKVDCTTKCRWAEEIELLFRIEYCARKLLDFHSLPRRTVQQLYACWRKMPRRTHESENDSQPHVHWVGPCILHLTRLRKSFSTQRWGAWAVLQELNARLRNTMDIIGSKLVKSHKGVGRVFGASFRSSESVWTKAIRA
jgi:hypothetical protein